MVDMVRKANAASPSWSRNCLIVYIFLRLVPEYGVSVATIKFATTLSSAKAATRCVLTGKIQVTRMLVGRSVPMRMFRSACSLSAIHENQSSVQYALVRWSQIG